MQGTCKFPISRCDSQMALSMSIVLMVILSLFNAITAVVGGIESHERSTTRITMCDPLLTAVRSPCICGGKAWCKCSSLTQNEDDYERQQKYSHTAWS